MSPFTKDNFCRTDKSDTYLKVSVSIWVLLILVIGIITWLSPLKHTVIPVYHGAVEQWRAGGSIYSSGNFHYFPQFVFMFMPFHFLPAPFGDIAWRTVSIFLFAWGLWRILNLAPSPENKLLFLCATLISLAPSFDAMRNGQANLLFAAFAMHATADLCRSRWWSASLCLFAALIAKPVGIAMILLAVLIYRALIWRLSLGLVVAVIFPFLFAPPAYVLSQYEGYLRHVQVLSHNGGYWYADLNTLLLVLGIEFTEKASPYIRFIAGVFTALIWLIGSGRMRKPEREWFLLGLTAFYLMLFNPMTETNSYVIVLPILSLYAVRFLIVEKRRILGWGMTFMGISIGILPELFRRADPNFGAWWSPLMMLFFGTILIWMILSKQFVAKGMAGPSC